MSTPVTPAVPTTPAEIAAANLVSQSTETPGQPPAQTVAPEVPAVPSSPTPDNPVVVTDLGGGRFKTQLLTGEVFEGTAQEILSKQGHAQVSTKLWAKDQVSKAAQPPVSQVVPQSPFANPEEAQAAEYAAGLVAKSLGYPDATTMRRALGMIQETSSSFAAQNVAVQFNAAQPDFNATPENTEKIFKVITDSGLGEVFDNAPPQQQVAMMRQAHAFCITTGQYQPKAAVAQPPRPAMPPPPAPVGSRPNVSGSLPPELVANAGDKPEVVLEKWNKARALGYQV